MNDPKLIDLGEMCFVGMGLDHNVHQSAAGDDPVPRLWGEFGPRSSEVAHSKQRYLGVSGPVRDGGMSNYVAALEVAKIEDLPLGMVSGVVPTGKYAQFIHQGPIERILGDSSFHS